ncbi:NAD(P)-binding protein [Trametopsis cervina]|nr:NAD(P)-binding protein [Trametopsis cervina]
MTIPRFSKALVVKEPTAGSKPVLLDTALETKVIPKLKQGEVLVRINAAAFNHRDLWIRKGLYPQIAFNTPLGADGAGEVIATGDGQDSLLNRRVFLIPMRGWASGDPPSALPIMGGIRALPIGAFSQYVVVEREHVIETPEHLDDEHIAAWPVGGVTAWRAVSVNAQVKEGDNVLITGIGGGVALVALQLCLALKANVYVSSGSEEKIRKAVELGAKGGVNYKNKDWPDQLQKLLEKHSGKGAQLSSAIDSGGGDLMAQLGKVLKGNGKVVCYGMTANPKITFTIREVLKNQQLLGSTMGSRQDLIDATQFIAKHKIVPIVSHVLDGLESAEEGFQLLQQGAQFGKIVIRLRHDDKVPSKL